LLLNLVMKTDTYDVNVTPDKRTIFVHEEKKILEALKVFFFFFSFIFFLKKISYLDQIY